MVTKKEMVAFFFFSSDNGRQGYVDQSSRWKLLKYLGIFFKLEKIKFP